MKPESLSLILRLSAFYDWLAFVLLMILPGWLLALFSHPVPEDLFTFRMAAMPLLVFPVVYLFAAQHGAVCRPLVWVSLCVRWLGALAIAALTLLHRPAGEGAYWFFAVGDLVWGTLYLWGALRTEPVPRSGRPGASP
jgi:hypothetical protein